MYILKLQNYLIILYEIYWPNYSEEGITFYLVFMTYSIPNMWLKGEEGFYDNCG